MTPEIGHEIEIAYDPRDAVFVGNSPTDAPERQKVLRVLASVPTIKDVLSKLSAGDVFRVVMSKENAHFFKQTVDGTYKPFLHNGKQFVENVDLIRVSPDYVGIVSNIALLANMAVIAARLDAIEVGVRNIARVIADTQRGRLKGALDALALAQALSDRAECRIQTMSATRDVVIELGALTGQLRAHIAAMPKETTGLFDGFLGSGFKEASAAYEQVRDDIGLLTDGMRAVLRAYHDLEEPGVAKATIERIVDGVREAGVADAIRKARLLPFSSAILAPELYLKSFLDAVTDMDKSLVRIEETDRPLIVIDLKPEELRG